MLVNVSWLLSHTKIPAGRNPSPTSSAVHSCCKVVPVLHRAHVQVAPKGLQGLLARITASPHCKLHIPISPHWPEGKRMSKSRSSCTSPLFSHHQRRKKQGRKILACLSCSSPTCNSQILPPGWWHLEAQLECLLTRSVLGCCATAKACRW